MLCLHRGADLASGAPGSIGMRFPFLPRIFGVVRRVIAGVGRPIDIENEMHFDWFDWWLIFCHSIAILCSMTTLTMVFAVLVLPAAWLGAGRHVLFKSWTWS
jgi:hypothetical protein